MLTFELTIKQKQATKKTPQKHKTHIQKNPQNKPSFLNVNMKQKHLYQRGIRFHVTELYSVSAYDSRSTWNGDCSFSDFTAGKEEGEIADGKTVNYSTRKLILLSQQLQGKWLKQPLVLWHLIRYDQKQKQTNKITKTKRNT